MTVSDPRLTCYVCGEKSVALAPFEGLGGFTAFWVPICQDCKDDYHNAGLAVEGLPVIPRNGVMLTRAQAESASEAIQDWLQTDVGPMRGEVAVMIVTDGAIRTGLVALNEELESENDND